MVYVFSEYDYVKLTDDENNYLEPICQLSEADGELPESSALTSHDNQTTDTVTVPSVVIIPSQDVTPPTATTVVPTPNMEPIEVTNEDSLDLNGDLLDILGCDPTADKKYGKELQKDLSVRLQHWTTAGLDKEMKKELKDRYLTPENCKLIDPPILNAEMKAAISEINLKRDKAIEGKQKILTSAITALGEAISLLLPSKDKDTALLKLLMDSIRIICDCQHADTVTRRNFVMGGLKREIREQLQNTNVDKYLFGENLAETLRSAKAICKTGTDLKPPAPKNPIKKSVPAPSTSTGTRNLNWQNPGPSRRPTGPQRMRQPAATSTNTRPHNSSRPSQHRQQRPSYTRR